MFNPHPAFIRSEQAFVSWNVNQKLPKVSEASKKYDRKYFDIQKELLRTFNKTIFFIFRIEQKTVDQQGTVVDDSSVEVSDWSHYLDSQLLQCLEDYRSVSCFSGTLIQRVPPNSFFFSSFQI